MEKIAFIDHSFHKKTKSSEFFIRLLQERYIVEIIWDESWQTGESIDISHIDETHYAVIFWQISPQRIDEIREKCANIIFCPMYDASYNLPDSYWRTIKNIKIINFSKTLHEQTCKMGFQSFYIQYYFNYEHEINRPEENNTVFFWNRQEQLNWNVVKTLLGKQKISQVHIHKALDPNYTFLPPDPEDESRFDITYSTWFNTKEEYLEQLQRSSIYIAPRLLEGIGFSFLEAMSMGKAVIGVNAPTMNEYIQHGYNGYLFDLAKPQEIDFTNINEVKHNAQESVRRGVEAWNKNKKKIFHFITAPIIIRVVENRIQLSVWSRFKHRIKKLLKMILPIAVIDVLKKLRKSG